MRRHSPSRQKRPECLRVPWRPYGCARNGIACRRTDQGALDGSTDLQAVLEQLGQKCEEGYWLKHVAVAEFDVNHKGEQAAHGGKTHDKPGEVEDLPQPTTPKYK